MSEKLIVWFETLECRDFCGTNGVVLYHTGDGMDFLWNRYGRDLGRYPVESEVPAGPALMVLEAEVCETTGRVAGAWRPATALDLIDADLLEGISTQLLDPDETRIDRESPLDFATLCEIAQADAKRRATDGVQ